MNEIGIFRKPPNGVYVTLPELIALKQQAQFDMNFHTHPAQQTGQYHYALRGRGMEFAEVRNYQAGDEIRHMEWRVTARTGRPHIKLYHEERERPVFMMVDFNPSMYFGTQTAFKSVIAARLATLIAAKSIKNKDKVGGVCFGAKTQHLLTPQTRDKGLMHLLGLLVTYTNAYIETPLSLQAKPFSEVLLKMKHVIKPGSLLIIISDFYAFDPLSEKYLSPLRQHNDLLALHITDPLEMAPPTIAGTYPLTNGKQTLRLETADPKMIQAYQKNCEDRQLSLKTRCQKLGMHYVHVMTNAHLPTLLHHTLSRAKHAN